MSAPDYVGKNAPDGTILGQSSSDKVSFYGATPMAQRANSAQALIATTAATSTSPYGFTSTQANALIAGFNEISTLLTSLGLWKGGA